MVSFALRRGNNIHRQTLLVGKADRAALKHQKPAIIWFTGLSGAGKSTIANSVEQRLSLTGYHTTMLTATTCATASTAISGLPRPIGWKTLGVSAR